MLLVVSIFLPIITGVCLLAFVAGVVLLKRKKRAIRAAQFEQLAQTLDLAFSPKDTSGFGKRLMDFDLFRRERRKWGSGGKINNVLSGQVGNTQVYLFDYSYIVSTGKSAHEVRQTVFFANNSNWSLPNFTLKPENWWRKVMLKAGVDQDINFPDNPDFSDRFWLKGDMQSLIREQFSPEIQQFLTARPPAHLEGNNYYLIAYKPGKSLEGESARAFFEQGCQLTELLQQQGGKDLLDLAAVKVAVKEEPDL
jgi:hypothetical protein